MSTDPFINIRSLTKSYGSAAVLSNIDLVIGKREVVSLIGASGSGKSTLMRCLNGLEPIQAGEIRIGGDLISGVGYDLVQLRRRVGMVFQSFNLFPHMTVLENCTLSPVMTGKYGRAEAIEKSVEMLRRVGLEAKAGAYPEQLSGGQQQRVAIARAMIMQPEVLLLDEITSALDPELVAEVLDLVRGLAEEGVTMVVTTHEMSFARDISTKVCFLGGTRIIEEGPPAQVFGDPRAPEVQAFLRSLKKAGRL